MEYPLDLTMKPPGPLGQVSSFHEYVILGRKIVPGKAQKATTYMSVIVLVCKVMAR